MDLNSISNLFDNFYKESENIISDDKNINNKNINNKNNKDYNENNNKCNNCDCLDLFIDTDYIICKSCSHINGEIIDYCQEWRNYCNEDGGKNSDPTRCGMPINPLLPSSSLGTIILGKGNECYRKLHRWHSMSYKERSLLIVFKKIDDIGNKYYISQNILDRAKTMYKTVSENILRRGSSRQGLIAACLYHSCIDKNNIITTKEIAEYFCIKIKKMNDGCKQFDEIMFQKNKKYSCNIQPTNSVDYIEIFCKKLNLDNNIKKMAIKCALIADNLGIISMNTPPSVAVGSIYLICQIKKLNIQKKYISEICSTSEVTITKAYKKLLPWAKILFY